LIYLLVRGYERVRLKPRTGREIMKGVKSVIVVATIIATAAVLAACEKGYRDEPLKLGAADVTVEQPAR
jgi:hypothetical protein